MGTHVRSSMSSWSHAAKYSVNDLYLSLVVRWVGLQYMYVIVAFPGHTHLLFAYADTCLNPCVEYTYIFVRG